MRRVFSIAAAFTLALLVTRLEPAGGQSATGSIPHGPDLLGIYMGMPADAAKAQLQKHSSEVYVLNGSPPSQGFGMSVPGLPTDQISVSITQAPNVPAVWKIQRDQQFSGLEPISQNALLDAIHRKYGSETFTKSPNPGYMQLYWIYGQNGQLLPAADAGLMQCNAVVPSAMKSEIAGPCAQKFYALYLNILSNGSDSVQSYTMVLINLPLAAHAAQLTADANKVAADQAQRAQDQKKNGRQVPTF